MGGIKVTKDGNGLNRNQFKRNDGKTSGLFLPSYSAPNFCPNTTGQYSHCGNSRNVRSLSVHAMGRDVKEL